MALSPPPRGLYSLAMALCAPQLACGVFGLGEVFTAAELAVADQLVQLSCSSGGDEAEASPSSSSSTTSSPRSVNTCAATLAATEEEEYEEFTGMAAEMELDRRSRKRYRLLSELYAATAPAVAKRGAACSSSRKRKRDDESPEAEAEIAMSK